MHLHDHEMIIKILSQATIRGESQKLPYNLL